MKLFAFLSFPTSEPYLVRVCVCVWGGTGYGSNNTLQLCLFPEMYTEQPLKKY